MCCDALFRTSERNEIPKTQFSGGLLNFTGPCERKDSQVLNELILTQFPELESEISWNVPTRT